MVEVHGLSAGWLLGSSGWLWVTSASLMAVTWSGRAAS